MTTENLFPIAELCKEYNVEITLVYELRDADLIEIRQVDNKAMISMEELGRVERLLRLQSSFDLSYEDVGLVYSLLEKMDRMQERIQALNNELTAFKLRYDE